MNAFAGEVNPHRLGLVLGGLYGLWHLTWSLLVVIGLAKPLLDLVLHLHFLQVTYTVASFNVVTALGLIIVTSAVGYLMGYVLGLLWNRFGPRRVTR